MKKNINKTLIASLLIVIMFLSNIVARPCYSEQSENSITGGNVKTIDVPIEKEYASVRFTLTFDYFDNYTVEIHSPDGKNVYNPVQKEELKYEAVINDVPKGVWQVKIIKPDVTIITDDTNTEEGTTGENLIEHNNNELLLREISPVKVQVEGSTEKIIDVTKDITVAEDIAGLKIYLKDDNLEIEWKTTTVGDINITVVNPETMEKLADERVKGNSFELPIPLDVQEVIVTISPSKSVSVEGSAKSYSVMIDNNPNASVTFEDTSITNKDTIKCTIINNGTYGAAFFVNNKKVEETEIKPSGEYEYEIPIEVGDNNIQTYIVSENGNMRSYSHKVTKDVVAPILKLESSYSDIKTSDEYLTINGKVEDYDYISINDKNIEVEGDHTFKYDYKLKEGVNNISIVAGDIAGNKATYEISAERYIPEAKTSDITKYITPIVIAIAIILLILSLIKKRGKKTAVDDYMYIPDEYDKKKDKVGEIKEEKKATNKNIQNSFFNKKIKKDNNTPLNAYKEDIEDEINFDNEDVKPQKEENNEIDKKVDKMRKGFIIRDIISILIPVITITFLFNFIFLVTTVESGSMEPALMTGNIVVYNRLAYKSREIQRGDVIVFEEENSDRLIGKRVIGIAGDEISFADGYVVLNGKIVDETDYIAEDIETNCAKTFVVPDGHIFVLGDNREDSYDSRFWENPYISINNIKGLYMGQFGFDF